MAVVFAVCCVVVSLCSPVRVLFSFLRVLFLEPTFTYPNLFHPLPPPPLHLVLPLSHSILIRLLFRPENEDWVLSTTTYGGRPGEPTEHFISSVQKGNVTACQFHPEKSGKVGLVGLI